MKIGYEAVEEMGHGNRLRGWDMGGWRTGTWRSGTQRLEGQACGALNNRLEDWGIRRQGVGGRSCGREAGELGEGVNVICAPGGGPSPCNTRPPAGGGGGSRWSGRERRRGRRPTYKTTEKRQLGGGLNSRATAVG